MPKKSVLVEAAKWCLFGTMVIAFFGSLAHFLFWELSKPPRIEGAGLGMVMDFREVVARLESFYQTNETISDEAFIHHIVETDRRFVRSRPDRKAPEPLEVYLLLNEAPETEEGNLIAYTNQAKRGKDAGLRLGAAVHDGQIQIVYFFSNSQFEKRLGRRERKGRPDLFYLSWVHPPVPASGRRTHEETR